jgi:hypothetical protein
VTAQTNSSASLGFARIQKGFLCHPSYMVSDHAKRNHSKRRAAMHAERCLLLNPLRVHLRRRPASTSAPRACWRLAKKGARTLRARDVISAGSNYLQLRLPPWSFAGLPELD